jgi:hypothetical protein
MLQRRPLNPRGLGRRGGGCNGLPSGKGRTYVHERFVIGEERSTKRRRGCLRAQLSRAPSVVMGTRSRESWRASPNAWLTTGWLSSSSSSSSVTEEQTLSRRAKEMDSQRESESTFTGSDEAVMEQGDSCRRLSNVKAAEFCVTRHFRFAAQDDSMISGLLKALLRRFPMVASVDGR